mmetsp:Transcript_55934/g.149175  ORF Transcript_55934/g.149175 Transcript_55934/m.149175 type:complete len:260 (+) Transcript_55934:398-1177(+)
MLATPGPEPREAAAVGPGEDAEAMLLILHVLASESSTVWPRILSTTVDHRGVPHALELAPVLPDEMPIPIDGISFPLPAEYGPVRPFVDSMSVLLAPHELPHVSRTAPPFLDTVPMLQVLVPLTTIGCHALFVVVFAKALRGIALPLANESISIGVYEFAYALHQAVLPLPSVLSTIHPSLSAHSVSMMSFPLSNVGSSCPERVLLARALPCVIHGKTPKFLELAGKIALASTILSEQVVVITAGRGSVTRLSVLQVRQ